MFNYKILVDWRLLLWAVNIFLILLTGVFPYIHNDFLRWNIVNHFNLMGEMTFAAWWSGSLLLLCAVLAFQISSWDNKSKHAWLILALIFSLLSFDEISSIHERALNINGGLQALIIAGLIGSVGYFYACWILWKNKHDKRGVIFLLIGLVVLGLAVPNEYLEHRINWPYYLEGPRAAFEEGAEFTGMFICLIGITRYQPDKKYKGSLVELTLNSEKPIQLTTIFTGGFLIHILLSWIVVRYITIEFRGNPAVWYFMAVFFVLALSNGWKAVIERSYVSYIYLFFFCYFMTLSAGSMYFILPRFNSKLHDLWLLANSNVLLGTQLIFLILLYIILRRIDLLKIVKFAIIAIALMLGWYIDNQFVSYVVSGLFALMIAMLFLPENNNKYFNRISIPIP
jgi:hypothetical protein